MSWFYWLIHQIIVVQRDIYQSFSASLKLFAETGDWQQLAIFLPICIVFGAAHALTPGHSKLVLATYTAGSPIHLRQALGMSLLLSLVHVSMAVVIALLSLPLVSRSLVNAGQSPVLQDVSRGLLGLIGLWMIWQALNPSAAHRHHSSRNSVFAFVSGLIPCPLTLFVMTFAISKGVPQAGVAFAIFMMLGVAITLSATAMISVVLRSSVVRLLSNRASPLRTAAVSFQVFAGLILVIVAINELFA
jgi:ABC-type nickel/cobalt efflux system permease component RcnA